MATRWCGRKWLDSKCSIRRSIRAKPRHLPVEDQQKLTIRLPGNLRIVERVIAIIVAIQSFAKNARARHRALARPRCFLRAHLETDSFPYLAGSAA